MSKNSLNGLLIRGAVVRKQDLGFILAYDPQKEDDEIPHTVTFRWKPDGLYKGSTEFNGHSNCIIEKPEYGIVIISEPGWYSIETRKGFMAGNIFDDSSPSLNEPMYAGLRSVSEIAGKAYAIGFRGMVYRLDTIGRWTGMFHGLPESFDGSAISGFHDDDIYAVGRFGQLWRYNGKKWTLHELPTNKNLTTIICAEDNNVYIAGHDGILVRGREDVWDIITNDGAVGDIWGLKWFKKNLYLSTLHGVYLLKEGEFILVDMGNDSPNTFYKLSATSDVMWSIGREDIMSFDGNKWTRVV